jgi:hypothetical protein
MLNLSHMNTILTMFVVVKEVKLFCVPYHKDIGEWNYSSKHLRLSNGKLPTSAALPLGK